MKDLTIGEWVSAAGEDHQILAAVPGIARLPHECVVVALDARDGRRATWRASRDTSGEWHLWDRRDAASANGALADLMIRAGIADYLDQRDGS